MRRLRNKRERQAAELARLFVALDSAAAERRGRRADRRARLSLRPAR